MRLLGRLLDGLPRDGHALVDAVEALGELAPLLAKVLRVEPHEHGLADALQLADLVAHQAQRLVALRVAREVLVAAGDVAAAQQLNVRVAAHDLVLAVQLVEGYKALGRLAQRLGHVGLQLAQLERRHLGRAAEQGGRTAPLR